MESRAYTACDGDVVVFEVDEQWADVDKPGHFHIEIHGPTLTVRWVASKRTTPVAIIPVASNVVKLRAS